MARPTKQSETLVLTLGDIQSSRNLKMLGVKVGDEVITTGSERKLNRVYSTPEDEIDDYQIITERDIFSSPTLQDLGAEIGDAVVTKNGKRKLVNTKQNNFFQELSYGFNSSGNFVSNTADYLTSITPESLTNLLGGQVFLDWNGFRFETAEELYGEEFLKMSPQERRDKLIQNREQDLQEEYGRFFIPQDNAAEVLGMVGKALLDPTTLLPIGQTYRGTAAIGGALGASYSASEDLAKTGEIDVKKAAITGAGTAALAPIVMGGSRIVSKKIGERSANKLVDEAQSAVNLKVAQGSTVKTYDDITAIISEAGLKPEKVSAAIKNTQRKIVVPRNASVAQKTIDEAITEDSAVSRLYSKTLDQFLGTLSTRIGNISQPLKYAIRDFEFKLFKETTESLKQASPFVKALRKIPENTRKQLEVHLFNGEFKAARKLMGVSTRKEFDEKVVPLLKSLGDKLVSSGHNMEKLPNYFPRVVKNYEGLLKSLGKEEQGDLTKQLQIYAFKLGKKIGNQGDINKLTNLEMTTTVNQYLRGYRLKAGTTQIKFIKQRSIKQIRPDQEKFYASAEESLSRYIRNSVNDVRTRTFLGRDQNNLEESIGSYITNNFSKINPLQQVELKELLQARFIGGETGANAFTRTLRDSGYLGTIANPISAITQLGDAGVASALKGFKPTLQAMFKTKEVKLLDIGIDDAMSKEFATGDPSKLSKLLDRSMTISGFKAVDRLGKETFINAALISARKKVKTPKGEAALRKELEPFYGEETESLISSLKSGRVDENVKLYLFNELAEIQPIALSEMPERYLNSPNGRIWYALKSFTLKQIDVVRKNVVQEWNKGNKIKAVKAGTFLAGYLSIANAGTGIAKDLLVGREVSVEELPERAVWSMLGVYGLNSYAYERYLKQGNVGDAVVQYIAPAFNLINAAGYAATGLIPDVLEEDVDYKKLIEPLPFIGKLAYAWLLGGAEKYNERLDNDRTYFSLPFSEDVKESLQLVN
jgi:hypothetical protein